MGVTPESLLKGTDDFAAKDDARSTSDVLETSLSNLDDDRERQRTQAERGIDNVTFFIQTKLIEYGIEDAEPVARKAGAAFTNPPNWRRSEKDLREARRLVTFAIFAVLDDLDRVAAIVDDIFTVLQKADPAS